MFKRSDSGHSTFPESQENNDPESQEAKKPVHTMNTTVAMSPKSGAAVIGASIRVRGDVSGEEDLIIRGHVEGTCSFPKNSVTVGGDGRVKANVEALNITIEGQVTGDLHGSEKVTVKASGRVEGNIVAPRVALEEGCQFKGSVDMNVEQSKPLSPDKGKAPVAHKKNGNAGADQTDILTQPSGAS